MRRWIRKDRTGEERRKNETHCHEMKERKKLLPKVSVMALFLFNHFLAGLTNLAHRMPYFSVLGILKYDSLVGQLTMTN